MNANRSSLACARFGDGLIASGVGGPVRTVEYYDVALGMYIIYLKPLYTVFTVRFKFFRHVD